MKLFFRLFVCGLLLVAVKDLRADTFFLANGGQLEGDLVNNVENPRTKYVVKTSGGTITLTRAQVTDVKKSKPAELQYVKLRPQYPDTVEGQWTLAEWCRERQLTEQRVKHLERVIELDPDHQKARLGLGYQKVEGEWKTRDEIFQDRGMVKDDSGRFRVPQQIDEIKRKREEDKVRKEWFKKIGMWRRWLDSDRAQEAQVQIQRINDPQAVAALHKNLQDESNESVRKMYIEALARIGSPDAWQVLILCSVDDADDEIRLSCLDYIEKQTNTGATGLYIKRLRAKDNVMVNRAGVALGRMKDAHATRPLIDALVTTHTFTIQPQGGNFNNTFQGGGGGTMSFGAPQPQTIARQMQNPSVLDALSVITGQNFGYDVPAWKRWLATQKNTQSVDARRD